MSNKTNSRSKGVRISDKLNRVVSVELNDILKELYGGSAYNWAIQEVQIHYYHGNEDMVMNLETDVRSSEFGKTISWPDLCALGNDVAQFIDLILMGSKDPKKNKWHQEPKTRYDGPDVYIEMFDSSCWEVFSKDHAFIDRLAKKFKDVEFLEPDFQEKNKA